MTSFYGLEPSLLNFDWVERVHLSPCRLHCAGGLVAAHTPYCSFGVCLDFPEIVTIVFYGIARSRFVLLAGKLVPLQQFFAFPGATVVLDSKGLERGKNSGKNHGASLKIDDLARFR